MRDHFIFLIFHSLWSRRNYGWTKFSKIRVKASVTFYRNENMCLNIIFSKKFSFKYKYIFISTNNTPFSSSALLSKKKYETLMRKQKLMLWLCGCWNFSLELSCVQCKHLLIQMCVGNGFYQVFVSRWPMLSVRLPYFFSSLFFQVANSK